MRKRKGTTVKKENSVIGTCSDKAATLHLNVSFIKMPYTQCNSFCIMTLQILHQVNALKM